MFVKNFELPSADATASRRVETRFLTRDAAGGAYGVTYRWREDNSDADRLTNSLVETIPIPLAPPGDFAGADIGGSFPSGIVTRNGNEFSLFGGGAGERGDSDERSYAWQRRRGDFDLMAQITLPEAAGAEIGLMARESLSSSARKVSVTGLAPQRTPAGWELVFTAAHRNVEREASQIVRTRIATAIQGSAKPPATAWLRLKRQGHKMTASASADGKSWTRIVSCLVEFSDELNFGMTVAGGKLGSGVTGRFTFPSEKVYNWYYPSGEDCLRCHTRSAGFVLGVSARQLNQSVAYERSGVRDNQLRAWNHIGLFDPPLEDRAIAQCDRLVPVSQESAPLDLRVRSYLDANCAPCHRPGGAPSAWDARFDAPVPLAGVVRGDVAFKMKTPGAQVVAPRDLPHSILFQRLRSVDQIKMPPLAKGAVDEDAVAAVEAWILSLPE